MRLHDIAKDTVLVFFTPETTVPIQGVLLVMNSVLSLEGKRMGKTAI